MFKKLALAVVIAIAAVLAFAATRPSAFRYERSATIQAPPERIFAHVNDFQKWRGWSPYEELDADLKRGYEGPASGLGSAYTWEGNNAGQGRMEITESTPPSKIVIKLDFIKPMVATNTAEFTFQASGADTTVTWAMYGENTLIAKVAGLFMDMDKLIGADFEKGLAKLKGVVESEPPPPPPPTPTPAPQAATPVPGAVPPAAP